MSSCAPVRTVWQAGSARPGARLGAGDRAKQHGVLQGRLGQGAAEVRLEQQPDLPLDHLQSETACLREDRIQATVW